MAGERSWTVLELLTEATQYLEGQGIESARVNAEVLLGHALGWRRVELYTRFDRSVEPAALAAFRELVRRRRARVPLQYITGTVEFYSRTFAVREGVFIPRPETETLVEKAIAALRGDGGAPSRPIRAAEVGVGSGAVLVTILAEVPDVAGVGTDVSAAALALARENAERHGVAARLELVEGSLVEPLAARGADGFDLLVANPPYLAGTILAGLEPEVRDHEPRAALVAGPDGFDAIRPLVADAWRVLRPGGALALEIGETQGAEALALVGAHGAYGDAALSKDYAGKDRVIIARRAGG
jgi:release factor glutamine methyltransferase